MQQLVELTPLSIDIRQEWITLLIELAKKRNIEHPVAYSRSLEHLIYAQRQCKVEIGEGLFVCRYGELDILDLDFQHVHETAAVLSYTNKLRRMAWALESGHIGGKTPEEMLVASDQEFIEGTAHAEWERDFYARKELARDVLNGKTTEKNANVGIFACPYCKSFDIDTVQKQTRSSDEPMTIFCSCNMCEKRFIR